MKCNQIEFFIPDPPAVIANNCISNKEQWGKYSNSRMKVIG
jgi:hypothetical protein